MQPALVILLAAFSAKRERKGVKWCREAGIGAARKMLGNPLPEGVSEIPSLNLYREAQQAAACILAAHCRICAGCKWGKE